MKKKPKKPKLFNSMKTCFYFSRVKIIITLLLFDNYYEFNNLKFKKLKFSFSLFGIFFGYPYPV